MALWMARVMVLTFDCLVAVIHLTSPCLASLFSYFVPMIQSGNDWAKSMVPVSSMVMSIVLLLFVLFIRLLLCVVSLVADQHLAGLPDIGGTAVDGVMVIRLPVAEPSEPVILHPTLCAVGVAEPCVEHVVVGDDERSVRGAAALLKRIDGVASVRDREIVPDVVPRDVHVPEIRTGDDEGIVVPCGVRPAGLPVVIHSRPQVIIGKVNLLKLRKEVDDDGACRHFCIILLVVRGKKRYGRPVFRIGGLA